MIKAQLFFHRNSKKKYLKLATGWDKTHGCECVIYCPDDEMNTIYTRSVNEWVKFFEEVRE